MLTLTALKMIMILPRITPSQQVLFARNDFPKPIVTRPSMMHWQDREQGLNVAVWHDVWSMVWVSRWSWGLIWERQEILPIMVVAVVVAVVERVKKKKCPTHGLKIDGIVHACFWSMYKDDAHWDRSSMLQLPIQIQIQIARPQNLKEKKARQTKKVKMKTSQ